MSLVIPPNTPDTRYSTEAQLQAAIRLAVGQVPGVVLWRNSAGVAEHFDVRANKSRKQRFGLTVGASDLIGLVQLSTKFTYPFQLARFTALELKLRGKLTDDQILFINLVNRLGGYADVSRNVDHAVQSILSAQRGERSPFNAETL